MFIFFVQQIYEKETRNNIIENKKIKFRKLYRR